MRMLLQRFVSAALLRSIHRLVLGSALACLVGAPVATAAVEGPSFRLTVREAGYHGFLFEDLAGADPELVEVESATIGLFHRGEAVPIAVDDGGDGRFGPGDRIVFYGDRPAGERSWYSEHTRENVYQLRLDLSGPGRRWEPAASSASSAPAPPEPILWRELHLEEEELRVRFSPEKDGTMPPVWYWERLAYLDRQPWSHEVDLGGFDPGAGLDAELSVHLWGWSLPEPEAREELADHRVEVLWNGELLAGTEWEGQVGHRLDIAVPAARIVDGVNRIDLKVPKRLPEEGGRPVLDVQLLDWVEIRAPVRARVDGDQGRWRTAPGPAGRTVEIEVADGTGPLLATTDTGLELELVAAAGTGERYRVVLPAGTAEVRVLAGSPRRVGVEKDLPSSWSASTHRADYLMITDRELRSAIEPLAGFHRERGLEVAVVDVQDVFDEWSHGIVDPEAIQSFVRHAVTTWQPPAPRFVLLVGDASWDPHHEVGDDSAYADWTFRPHERRRFGKNESTGYDEARSRNRIPSWNVATFEGYAASDNPYVDVDDDGLPDLAIGRFPVVDPAEVRAIVEKSVRHARQVDAGSDELPRRSLWITNEARGFQLRSDRLIEMIEAKGFAADRVYPSPEEADNSQHQQRLLEAFDGGQTLVHFLGHGGRYIWRTGPPDLQKNHDLFTLEHLDQLEPAEHLPVVLSMTCYSAPFDHPTADSIGEKLLRIEDRGAVAVFAASWRNAPSVGFSEDLVRALTKPGTVGEAILEAKREARSSILIETYNLLGDPALPVVAGDESAEPGPDVAR